PPPPPGGTAGGAPPRRPRSVSLSRTWTGKAAGCVRRPDAPGSMVPGKLGRVEQRPVEVFHALAPLAAVAAAEPQLEMGGFLGAGAARQHGQVRRLHRGAVVGRQRGNAARGVEQVFLGALLFQLAVHEEEALRDGAAAAVELVVAVVAVALHEIALVGVADEPGDDVRV